MVYPQAIDAYLIAALILVRGVDIHLQAIYIAMIFISAAPITALITGTKSPHIAGAPLCSPINQRAIGRFDSANNVIICAAFFAKPQTAPWCNQTDI